MGSNGNIPVAIFGSMEFDATLVDPLTVDLAGAGVKLKGNGTPQSSVDDVDEDGYLDLVVHVSTQALELADEDTSAVLTGQTYAGDEIEGTDTIRVVP